MNCEGKKTYLAVFLTRSQFR